MSYSVKFFRGYFYIIGNAGVPTPRNIGPYRYETEARNIADQLNKETTNSAEIRADTQPA